jgi:hypothetical protein
LRIWDLIIADILYIETIYLLLLLLLLLLNLFKRVFLRVEAPFIATYWILRQVGINDEVEVAIDNDEHDQLCEE